MEIFRYAETENISSILDPFDDILIWITYLTSEEYLKALLINTHQVRKEILENKINLIIPHLKIAIKYIMQSRSCSEDLSFLLAYYGILNLIKIYIILSPHCDELKKQKLHGVQWIENKTSNFKSEKINILTKGSIPLFYKAITNQTINEKIECEIANIYPYVSGVSAEYNMTFNRNSFFYPIKFYLEQKKEFINLKINIDKEQKDISINQIKLFNCSFTQDQSNKNIFISENITTNTEDPVQIVRKKINTFLLYYPDASGNVFIPLISNDFLLPEEIPIALTFFHMSSIIRYDPISYEYLRSSMYWPFLSAVRRHSLFTFLKLFWSFMHKKNLIIHHE